MSLTVRPVVGRRAKISALGTYVPPDVITNQDLEKMVETSDQWIMERTGIQERHVLAKGLGVSDMCAEAAKNASPRAASGRKIWKSFSWARSRRT